MDAPTLIKHMRETVETLDRAAKIVSNTNRPRKDNACGRAAQKLEEAANALSELTAE